MPILSSQLAGVAGQYFVAAELSRRGYIVAMTLRNTKGIDLLVSNSDGREIGIQVKTTRSKNRRWLLNTKAEDACPDSLWYIFVSLKGENEYPDFFVVKGNVVADYVRKATLKALRTPGKDGRRRKDSGIREFHDPDGKYLNKWESLFS